MQRDLTVKSEIRATQNTHATTVYVLHDFLSGPYSTVQLLQRLAKIPNVTAIGVRLNRNFSDMRMSLLHQARRLGRRIQRHAPTDPKRRVVIVGIGFGGLLGLLAREHIRERGVFLIAVDAPIHEQHSMRSQYNRFVFAALWCLFFRRVYAAGTAAAAAVPVAANEKVVYEIITKGARPSGNERLRTCYCKPSEVIQYVRDTVKTILTV